MSSYQEWRGHFTEHFTESGTIRSRVKTNLNTDGKDTKREVHFHWKREALRIIFGPERQKQITFPFIALPSHLPAQLKQLHGWPAQARIQMDQTEPSEQPAEFLPRHISLNQSHSEMHTHSHTPIYKQRTSRFISTIIEYADAQCTFDYLVRRKGGHQTEISHTAERWKNWEAERLRTSSKYREHASKSLTHLFFWRCQNKSRCDM